jgi:uncharacterized protein YciI
MTPAEIPGDVEIEPLFLVEARYTPEAAERRPTVRAQHLARIAELKRTGVIVEAGAYADGLTTSLLLVRVPDAESALAVARADIYASAGVWGEIAARPFGRVALRATTGPGEGSA